MLDFGYHNMDCLKGMKEFPDKYFDLAIVDPEYGIGDVRFSGSARKMHKKINWNDKIPSKLYFEELRRVSKNQIIWGCNYYHGFIPESGRIVHDKILTRGPMSKNLSPCDLASQTFDKKIHIFRYQWSGNVQNGTINWNNSGLDKRIHPTQKPVALYQYCLSKFAKTGDIILDTHVGSGSSLIACLDLGLDFVGFEIDADYYQKSYNRIDEYKSMPKFNLKSQIEVEQIEAFFNTEP